MVPTYAILTVTADTFEEIATKLQSAGYHHAFKEDPDGKLIIDLSGIALRDEDEEQPPYAIGEPVSVPDPEPLKHGRPS